MTALSRFRDHCRRMAEATREKPVTLPGEGRCWPDDDERALWTRLADEVDAYLTVGANAYEQGPIYDIDQDGFDFGAADHDPARQPAPEESQP